MKIERGYFGIVFAPVKAAEPHYVTLYKPVEANIAYRLDENPPRLLDRYCGDPTIDGWIALNEKLVGRELGPTIGEIWYIQETDPQSDKQVLKGSAIEIPPFEGSDSPNKYIKCISGPADGLGNFELICAPEHEEGTFYLEP